MGIADRAEGLGETTGEYFVDTVAAESGERQIVAAFSLGIIGFFFPEPITTTIGAVLLIIFVPLGVLRMLSPTFDSLYPSGGS